MCWADIDRKEEEKMRNGRFGRLATLALLVPVAAAFQAGCYGKFQLTRTLYDVNRSVGDKYLRSAVTWLLVIPYGFAGFLDFCVFNVIEFWSGENPIAAGTSTREYSEGDDRAVMTVSREGKATVASVHRYHAGSLVFVLRIRDDGAGSVTADRVENGRVAGTVTTVREPDGSVSVTEVSPAGTKATRLSPEAVETHRSRVARIAGDIREGGAGPDPLAALLRIPSLGG